MKNELLSYHTKLINNFINYDLSDELIHWLDGIDGWDLTYKSRKTISFGKAYIGDRVQYLESEMPKILQKIIADIAKEFTFKPNNCLINFYYDGRSKMGFHSDNTNFLVANSGIIIVSINDDRVIRFRSKSKSNQIHEKEIVLKCNSLFYMSTAMQEFYEHSIIEKVGSDKFRVSLTFRKVV